MIKIYKQEYYHKLFKNTYNEPKKMWELINSLAVNRIKNSIAPPKLISGSSPITDGTAICDLFNSYFSSIGADLANQIPLKYHTDTSKILMYGNSHKHDLALTTFRPCSKDEINKIIDALNTNTSTGLDGFSTKAIKCVKHLIADKLSLSINTSLELGIFPDSLKIAKVSPIYKCGSKTDPSNYRPISVLPVVSKIFERILYDRLSEYLTEKQILIDEQYGFRPKCNTLTAAIDLISKIKTNIDKKNIAIGIFIDLKKAFDTVSHEKLILKLKDIGIDGPALSIFKSYLENRSQIVKIDNFMSSPQNISYGIPQGSILGPLLFLIYINNINKIGLTGHLTLYADDTCLFYFDKSIHDIINDAQKDLDIINEWLLHNLLTINTTKTSYIILAAKNKTIPQFEPLRINNKIIERSHQEKYLGLLIDDKLTWQPHIDHLKSKLTSTLGALRKISHCLPKTIKPIIYNSLVKSHLDYLIEIWGSAAPTNLSPLQRIQNKIIKVLFHYSYDTPTQQLYKKTKLFNIAQLYKYNTCLLIKKIISNKIKSNIQLNFKTNLHSSRRPNQIEITKSRTKFGTKTIQFEGAMMFNNLPNEIRTTKSVDSFKHKLKAHIIATSTS